MARFQVDDRVTLGICGSAIPYQQCHKLAKSRHLAGYYDLSTLACYRRAWLEGRKPGALLAYLSFRRDLGYPVNVHGQAALLDVIAGMSVRDWLAALNLLAETSADLSTPASIPWLVRQILGHELYLSPPLAAWLLRHAARRGNSSHYGSGLARIETDQLAWREAFKNYLSERLGSICVVGNAGTLAGSRQGAWIDGHSCVIRFNQYASGLSNPADIGERTDVWVRAPGFSPRGLGFSGEWVVVSGPDARYRLTNWRHLAPLLRREQPVLTVPITVWRSLVGHLHAPPSAGLLILAWLRALLGSLKGVSVIGFSTTMDKPACYHHALPDQSAVNRHRWNLEQLILEKWSGLDGA